MRPSLPVLLSLDTPNDVISHLQDKGWIDPNEKVLGISKAGEGNMNVVLRIEIENRSFILKQSRPWVVKYPQIAAPQDRILSEVTFYEAVKEIAVVAEKMPTLLAFDRPNRIAQFEDLGPAADFTSIYNVPDRILETLPALCEWLSALHAGHYSDSLRTTLSNRDMRELNHEHIFHLPLSPDNFLELDSITPGLQAVGSRLQENQGFVEVVAQLGERYLKSSTGEKDVLLHGDFYPGSWLNTPTGPRIIDPEFCFFGDAEFDVGVFMAHLFLAGCTDETAYSILDHYKKPTSFDDTRAFQYAGTEIMRRLIGVAQLPLQADLGQKEKLLLKAEKLVLGN